MSAIIEHRPRKRLKRETKSCVECRKRKVKCSLATKDAPSCEECLKRSFSCVSVASGSGFADGQPPPASSSSHDERLDRIEGLLAQLVDQLKDSPGHHPESGSSASEANQDVDTPILSFSRNGIAAPHKQDPVCGRNPATPPNPRTPQYTPRQETGRLFLLSLFPSECDATLINRHTNAWALNLNVTPGAMPNPQIQPSTLDSSSLSHSQPTVIGQAPLYLALCIQQLPPDFALSGLEMQDPESRFESYLAYVNSLVLADEELLCSIEGIECLILLGMIYINDGALQKAWLTFRRAMDTSRLLGLHKSYAASARAIESPEAITRRRIWLSVVMADAYVSLILGLEPGSGEEPFGPDDSWEDPFVDEDTNFQRRLALIAARLAHRDLSRGNSSYGPTGALDEALDVLESSMPHSWWQVTNLKNDRSPEAARDFDRLLFQTWFFQLRAFTHCPYVFRAIHEKKFEYCRSSCLDACGAILQNYLALRRVNNTQLHCRGFDFGAFTAGVAVLMLHTQDSRLGTMPGRTGDVALVEETLQSMDFLARSCKREVVAKQSVDVLTKLLEYRRAGPGKARDLQLTVPYFGTVAITAPTIAPTSPGFTPFVLPSLPDSATPPVIPAYDADLHSADQYTNTSTSRAQPFSVAFDNPLFSMGGSETLDLPALPDLDAMDFDSLRENDILNWEWNPF